jgi:hypothetical protein
MNPNVSALKAALILIGETEESIAFEYLFKRVPEWPSYKSAFAPRPGEAGYKPRCFPEWMRDQPPQDMALLYEFAWERIWAETQKAVNLEAKHPDLLNNPEFVAYKQAVQHASDIAWGCPMFVAGKGCVKTYAEPDLKGHRIGSWDEVSEGM